VGEAAEVERLAPTVFVQIGGKVVVAACQLVQLCLAFGILLKVEPYCLVKVAYSAVRACSGGYQQQK
jgi:hypothetical protein